jgi:hypothetical protein
MKKTNKILTILGCAALGLAGIGVASTLTSKTLQTKAAVTAGTYIYDFMANYSTYATTANGWTSSYADHTIDSSVLGTSLPAATVSLSTANSNSSTIKTMPVSKASSNSFTLSESGFVITSVEVVVSQWTTKVPTIYVKEAGASANNYSGAAGLASSGRTGTEGTTGVITFTGSSVTSFNFGNTSTNQIGWKAIKITIATAAAFGTLSSISILSPATTTSFEVGNTFSSEDLALTAKDTSNVTKTVTSGYTTNFDSHVFVTTDLGTKTVTVSYTEGSVTATTTYTISVTAAPVYTHDFTTSADACFTANYNVAGNVAAGEYNGYKALNGLGWDLDAKYSGSLTGVEYYGSALTLGTNSIVCSSFTLTSDIFGVSDNYAINKIAISLAGNSSLVGQLTCKVGGADFGTQSQTVPTTQTDIVFSSTTPAYGKIELGFSQTSSKGLKIYNIRVYAETGSGNTHDAYVFAKKVEAANGCVANSTLVTEFNNLSSEVKSIASSIAFNDYATAAIKAATIPYKDLAITVATKIDAINAISGSGAANRVAANENSNVYVYAASGIAVFAVAAFFYFRKKKQA